MNGDILVELSYDEMEILAVMSLFWRESYVGRSTENSSQVLTGAEKSGEVQKLILKLRNTSIAAMDEKNR